MKQGFTLIELLVVVLIIGILSSVALPQYTKAVEKARASEAELMLRSLRDAQARCFLERGTDSVGCTQGDVGENLFDVMDIELNLPTTEVHNGGCCGRKGKYFTYSLDGEYIYAERRQKDELLYYLETTALPNAVEAYNEVICNQETMDCKNIGYSVFVDNNWVKP